MARFYEVGGWVSWGERGLRRGVGKAIGRAFQPLLAGVGTLPRAMPWAGMERAVGALMPEAGMDNAVTAFRNEFCPREANAKRVRCDRL